MGERRRASESSLGGRGQGQVRPEGRGDGPGGGETISQCAGLLKREETNEAVTTTRHAFPMAALTTHRPNAKLVSRAMSPDFIKKKTHTNGCVLAQLRLDTQTVSITRVHSSVCGDDSRHTCIQIVTWSHTAEPTLAVTQALAPVATVPVGLAGPRTRPPALLSQKSIRTQPCGDTTHAVGTVIAS